MTHGCYTGKFSLCRCLPKSGRMKEILWMVMMIWPWVMQGRCIQGDCLNGNGIWQYTSGARYEGPFIQGKRQGYGKVTFSDGSRYSGEFYQDFRQGEGVHMLSDQSVYSGRFYRDHYHGTGRMQFRSGAVYEGSWIYGKMEGQGILTFPDRTVYKGEFHNNAFHGNGQLTQSDGTIYMGEWQYGQRNGTGYFKRKGHEGATIRWVRDKPIFTFPFPVDNIRRNPAFVYGDGSMYWGMKNTRGFPEGIGICQYKNGDLYEGGWQDHRPDGPGILTSQDGQVRYGIWKAGRLAYLEEGIIMKDYPVANPVRDPAVNLWAVFVGVQSNFGLEKLNYPEKDAAMMATVFTGDKVFSADQSNIHLLTGHRATYQGIMNVLWHITAAADENDIVLFYFSGHGQVGGLIPFDYDDQLSRLEYATLLNILDRSVARKRFAIIDACHSGSALATGEDVFPGMQPILQTLMLQASGTQWLLSSGPPEYSLEDSSIGSGIFSYYLRKALLGAADEDGNQRVDNSELQTYLTRNVSRHSKGIQSPVFVLHGEENGFPSNIRP